jgi:hypothetical protein
MILMKKRTDLSEKEVNYLHSLKSKELKILQWKHRLIELIIREDMFDSLSESGLYSLYIDAEQIVKLSIMFNNKKTNKITNLKDK